ncbi:MAG: type II toxin-antitoxin system VapC family toxin [Sphingomonas adhaesiva]|uniref:type II toxin-antitoxin system VapC family toxin n=1 Tax=Sphingomonas adhaesiva TaxID=28212 RepID=UPI002FF7586A
MALLIDTQTLVWLRTGDPKLSRAAQRAIADEGRALFVSAVTAYEFADLDARGRFGAALDLQSTLDRFFMTVLDFPEACWRIAAELPMFHRDPVDRMLIAHALHAGLTLVTADETIRRYPVPTLW